MDKVKRAFIETLYSKVKECYKAHEICRKSNGKEGVDEYHKAFNEMFLLEVQLLDEVTERKNRIICDLARAMSRSDLSISRFIKCLEVCGIEVVE